MARFHLVAGHKHEGGSVDFSADDVSHALSLAYQLTAGHTFALAGEAEDLHHSLAGGVARNWAVKRPEKRGHRGVGRMHNVLFMAEGQVIGRASWSGSLAGARRYALDYMRVRKADHVEVRDDEDEVVFQHPEESSSVH